MDEEIYPDRERKIDLSKEREIFSGGDSEIYPEAGRDISIEVNEPREIVPGGAPDAVPQVNAGGTAENGTAVKFPIAALILSFIEIISALLFMRFNENVWYYDLQSQALIYFLTVLGINITAWVIILKKKLYDIDKFIRSWEFAASVIAPYMIAMLLSGLDPTKQYGEAADWIRLLGGEHIIRILLVLIGVYRGFPGFFDFHWYTYLIILGGAVFLIWNRKRSALETILLTAIHPLFLLVIFRLIFNVMYEIVGYTSF